jgi:hypothetical protein
MSVRKFSCDIWRFYSISLLLAFLTTLALPRTAQAQGLEVGGGWSHVTGDSGTDGLNVGAAWWFTKKVTIAADYDTTWDNTSLTNFAFTQVGAIATKSHLQSFLAGPRIFFSTSWTDKYKLTPFGEAQFGVSHLKQEVSQANMPSVTATDTAFTWMLGGGGEYLFSSHFSGRANVDFQRTHFSSQGQSRLRLVLGIRYTFGSREHNIAPATASTHIRTQTPDSVTVLLGLEQRWADALQRGDTATLENILDDAYVDTNEMGHHSTKQELIDAVKSGDLKINTIKLSGMQVREAGNSAMVTGRAVQNGTFKGQALTEVVTFSDTFVMRSGTWKAVASYRTPSH